MQSLYIMYSIIEFSPYISGFVSWAGEFVELVKYDQIFHSGANVPRSQYNLSPGKNHILMDHSYKS